jgi:hypothetical protein
MAEHIDPVDVREAEERQARIVAVNAARAVRDAEFRKDTGSVDMAAAYEALASAYSALGAYTDDAVAKAAMQDAALALTLLAGEMGFHFRVLRDGA